MGYRFCLGASGAGKSTYLHREVIRRAADALDHLDFQESWLFLVPDQFTMQEQKELVLAAGERGGIMNVDVLSFGRLSHRIFEEIGADSRGVLDDMGKNLILRRLSLCCQKELTVLGKRIGRPGMTAEIKSVISEFMQYGITPDGVGELSDYAAANGQRSLSAKLRDIQVLYQAFAEERSSRFLTGEEQLDLLAEAIPQSRLIGRSVVIFDGFTGFTPLQLRVVGALMQCAREVVIALDWAEDGGTPIGEVAAGQPWEEQDLFCLTRQTVAQISRLAQRLSVPHGEDLFLNGTEGGDGGPERGAAEVPVRFAGNPALAHLERTIFRYPVVPYGGGSPAGEAEDSPSTAAAGVDAPEKSSGSRAAQERLPVHLVLASNPSQEVRQLCIRIRKTIEATGWAYRDLAVIAGDLSAYEDEIRVCAQRYDIPVYIDSRRAVLQNPLTETIRGALEIGAGDYSYETVFRFLRSGLSGLPAEGIDRLENYVLARGIASRRRWESAFDAPFEPMRQRFLEEIRPLQGQGRAGAPERTKALYEFLVGIEAGEQMIAMAGRLRGKGKDAEAMEYEQIYGAVIHLLEELYDLPGEEAISAKDYLELVETGFQEIRLGTLPQQVDRILVGDLERTRLGEVKALYVLGVNDGAIPKGAAKGGLLSDLDREFLQESKALRDAGLTLAPTPRQQMVHQRLYLYMNLTRPTQELVLSFSASAGDGSSIRPSYLIGLMQQMFPSLIIERPEEAPVSEQVMSPGDAASFLSRELRSYADGLYLRDEARTEEFLTLYGYCAGREKRTLPFAPGDGDLSGQEQEAGGCGSRRFSRCGQGAGDSGGQGLSDPVRAGAGSGHRVRDLRDAAFLRYRPRPVTQKTAQALYGRAIRGSVTRLETAAECYLHQFLQYGLRLREREIYTFESKDSGTILHESICRFGQLLKEAGLSWTEYTPQQGRELMGRALRETAGAYNDQVMYATARDTFQAGRLQRILERTADTLQFQLLQGDFAPAALEQEFGGRGDLRYALEGGGELILRGRIDRVDLVREDGRIYVKVVDYKSGNHDLDPAQMRAGLQLQLMLYMTAERKILQRRSPGMEIVPAALLYYHFEDPMLTGREAADVLAQGVPGAGAGSAAAEACADRSGGEVPAFRGVTEIGSVSVDSPEREDDPAGPELTMIRRKLRPKGLVTGGTSAMLHLDRGLAGKSVESLAVPVKTKKDGTPDSRSRVMSEEEFEDLSGAVQQEICRLAEEILQGRADAAPVRMGNDRTACTWCPYSNACGFDVRTPGYEYRDGGRKEQQGGAG